MEIVPVAVEPPVIPFTFHVTAWLVELATVAVNCDVAPRRVLAAPDTVTVTVLEPPPPLFDVNDPAEQPLNNARKPTERTATLLTTKREQKVEVMPATKTSKWVVEAARHMTRRNSPAVWETTRFVQPGSME